MVKDKHAKTSNDSAAQQANAEAIQPEEMGAYHGENDAEDHCANQRTPEGVFP